VVKIKISITVFCCRLVLSLFWMRFQILPIWEGQRETVFTCTSLFSLRVQPEPRPSKKSQVWLWNRICKDWLQLWAQSDASALLQKLPAETSCSHWYSKGKTEGCATLGCLIKTEFRQRMLFPYVRMFAISSLWWSCDLPFMVAVSLVLK